jgi:hypothetical protein
MRKIIYILLASLCSMPTFAQFKNKTDTFYFDKPKAVDGSQLLANVNNADEHYLGKDIAEKVYLVKHQYTYFVSATPDSPGDKNLIKKQVIYDAFKKLDKYYKKQYKDNKITFDQAHDKTNILCDKLLIIVNENTRELERRLKKLDKEKDIENLFSRVVIK